MCIPHIEIHHDSYPAMVIAARLVGNETIVALSRKIIPQNMLPLVRIINSNKRSKFHQMISGMYYEIRNHYLKGKEIIQIIAKCLINIKLKEW